MERDEQEKEEVRVPIWLHASHGHWVKRQAVKALGRWTESVEWMLDRERWLGKLTPLRIVVCDDLSDPILLEGLSRALKWPGALLLLTTDDPVNLRFVIGTGVKEVFCLPVHAGDVEGAVRRALGGWRRSLEEHVSAFDEPLLRLRYGIGGSLRQMSRCLSGT